MKLLFVIISMFPHSLAFAQSGSRGGGGSSDGFHVTQVIQQTISRIRQHYQLLEDHQILDRLSLLQKNLRVLMVSSNSNAPLLSTDAKHPDLFLVNEALYETEPSVFIKDQLISLFIAEQTGIHLESYLEKDHDEYLNLYFRKNFRCMVGSLLVSFQPAGLASQSIAIGPFKLSTKNGAVIIENLKSGETRILDALLRPYLYGPDKAIVQSLEFKDGKINVSCE